MDDKLQKKLHDLFVIYSKKLPDKIAQIEHQWQELLSKWDKLLYQNLHRDVHSLCGSAGTYGYNEVSKKARELEVYLKALLDNNSITQDEQKNISSLIDQIKKILLQSTVQTLPAIETGATETIENQSIFLLEKDDDLSLEIKDSLEHAGYATSFFSNLTDLQRAAKNKTPIALILDTDYLDAAGIQCVVDLQADQTIPIQIFCIVPNKGLLPRLAAIRAGSNAFFQKPVDVSYLLQIINQKCSISSGDPYRILIIDDSESLGEYYSLILKKAGMIPYAITNPMELITALEEFQPDLLLMDIYMPECTGLELAGVLRQESLYTKIPIIFLSTEDNKLKQLSAISLGGDDFLTKPISAQHLISAVRSRAKRAGILNYYMTTDSLTGLLNHSSLLRRLDIEILHARQQKSPLSFLMIDIDHFKKINDTYGHLMGDVVIKKIATFLLLRLRSQDIVGRYGGEEFAIILAGANIEQSKKICDNLRQQFSQIKFSANNSEFSVTISGGISTFSNHKDAHSIITEADEALYKAKQLGRNQVVTYQSESLS